MGAPETADELRARLAMAQITARHKDRSWVTIDTADRDALLARLATADARTTKWKADAERLAAAYRWVLKATGSFDTFDALNPHDALVAEDTVDTTDQRN